MNLALAFSWVLLLAPGTPQSGDGAEVAVDVGQAEEALEAGEVFVAANSAYEEGDYAAAIAGYEALLRRGVRNGYLHYNLGNAYLRNGELGRAIASYRRCQLLMPRHRDVAANLAFARQSARDAIEPPAPPAILQTLFFWHYGLSHFELMRLAVGLNVLFWGVLALRLRQDSELLRWAWILLLLLLISSAGSLLVHTVRPNRVAVIVPQEINVHSGTDLDTVVRFKLHAGTEVRAPELRDEWLRIRLPDGEEGWIEAEHAEILGRS